MKRTTRASRPVRRREIVVDDRGFSLVEMSVVLVIVGLLISVGATVLKTLNQSSKMAKERANITAIQNALTAYGLSRGHLPCPDTDGDGSGNCPVSSCGTSPCTLPYLDLNISTATKDIWSMPYHYDVTDILTTTSAETMCLVTYQLNNLYSWYGNPANAACGTSDLVCVTSESDADDGRIGTSGGGYYLAAYINSRGEDKVLGGKNRADGRREYEMSSNRYDVTAGRDDLVGELTFAGILDKACSVNTTTINAIVTSGEVWLDNSGGCVPTTGLTGTVVVGLGQRLFYKAGCTENSTFEELARCDLNPAAPVYSGAITCNGGTALDGAVRVNAGGAAVVITQ